MKKIFTLIATLVTLHMQAQDLLSSLGNEGEEKDYVIATFKGTRLINQQTLESVGKRTLDFRISHRFGAINSGFYDAWGIDKTANIRLSLDYSFDGRFMFGIGRSSFEKMDDGFLKYRLLRQTTDNKMPFSVTLFAAAYYIALKDQIVNGFDYYEHRSSRLSYCYEIMIGRKFSKRFSLQVSPWFVHYNMVKDSTDENDTYGISGMFRFKFTNRSAITAEYAYRLNKYSPSNTFYDSFGIGYEIETGGHVFQVHIINSFGLAESQFFPQTDTKWNNAGIRLGFNVSRVFSL